MRCQRRRSLDWLSLSFLFSRCLLLFNNLLKKLVTHNSFHPSIQSQIFLYMYCFFIFDHFQRLRWVLAFTQSPLWRASSVLLFWRVFFFSSHPISLLFVVPLGSLFLDESSPSAEHRFLSVLPLSLSPSLPFSFFSYVLKYTVKPSILNKSRISIELFSESTFLSFLLAQSPQ